MANGIITLFSDPYELDPYLDLNNLKTKESLFLYLKNIVFPYCYNDFPINIITEIED